MRTLNSVRLEVFARLIGQDCPPPVAARRAGYRDLRARRAARRDAGDREPNPGDAPPSKSAPFPPEMTEEEWLAEFGPMLRAHARKPDR